MRINNYVLIKEKKSGHFWTKEHTDGHGREIWTLDIRTDMGHKSGHGTYGRTFANERKVFINKNILFMGNIE